MPQYSYTCPSCHHTETRVVKIAERDTQYCSNVRDKGPLEPAFPFGPDGEPVAFELLSSPGEQPKLRGPCQAKLERADIETTADMRQTWRAGGSGC